MTETKKSVVKKEDLENLKKIKEEVKEEVVEISEPEETVEEHIFKTSEKKNTFAEKSAEAAANAALKAAINANNEISIREAEKAYFIEKKNHMLKKCKKDKKVTRTISKFYAPYLGKVYTFLYNGIPVTLYCDGKPHEYPGFIAEKIDKKLAKIAESNTYKEVIDERLDQDTF